MKSPKISEEKKIHTFNRLIEDSNRRTFNLYQKKPIQNKKNKSNNNNKKPITTKNKNIKNKKNIIKKVNKSFDKKKWDEIYERRFSSKLKERNEKLEKLRQEKEDKKKKEEDLIIDNLNKKQILINKKYGMKRSNSVNNLAKTKNNSFNSKYYMENNKVINNLNQRLYYNELNKKDIDYKTFMDKAQELLSDSNSDYFYYLGRHEKNGKEGKKYHKKTNVFRTGYNLPKNKKLIKSNSVYTFKDCFDSNNNENKQNDEKNYKIIKGILNNNDKNNNIDISKSDNQDLVNMNSISKEKNNSAEKIIDRFFEN